MFTHWKKYDNVCKWTAKTKADCNINENLRTFGRLIFKDVSDDDRNIQKTWLSIALFISLIKIMRYFDQKRKELR